MALQRMILSALVSFVCVSSTLAQEDVVYPTMYQNQRLATRINCQTKDPEHFHYSSTTNLWGPTGGQIQLDADVMLDCLGDDSGGKFGSEALKFRVEISDLRITDKTIGVKESLKREKRGVGEFFSSRWNKVKQFFKRVFGSTSQKPEVTEAVDDSKKERKDTSEEEEPEVINQADYESLYSTPFLFVQLANGSIPEIRFSENEEDNRVKNFKRHLVDAFSTQLNFNEKRKSVVEKSVMGEHKSTYNISVNEESIPISVAGVSFLKSPSEPTVVVNKVVTGSDILSLAPSEALNDRQSMELVVQQVQVFQKGRMVSSSGTSSIVLLPNAENENRIRRDVEEDATKFIQAQSSFDIQLQKRSRRSSPLRMRTGRGENEAYLPASRIAEIEESSERGDLQLLQSSAGNMEELIESLSNGKDIEYDEKVQLLLEIVEREVKLELDKEDNSISSAVKIILSQEVMQNLCVRNSSVCRDFLQLLALAGGPKVEQILLHFLLEKNSPVALRTIADIISDVAKPSPAFLRSLSDVVQGGSLDPDAAGAVILSLGHLGTKAEDKEEKQAVSRVLVGLLEERQISCRFDPFVIDVLEAVGNLKCEDTVPTILKISEQCWTSVAIQIACAHALRHAVHLPGVQTWVRNLTSEGDCHLLKEVVGALTDKIQEQEMQPEVEEWPRCDFNDIDVLLQSRLTQCPSEDILRYFRRKRNEAANALARSSFGPGSEPWNPRPSTRQRRRAVWDDLNCKEWTEDKNYTPIQDEEEFAADRATYNRRRSCLAFRRLGVKGANAEIYAGMFAGVKELSDPPKYKLFTKFVSGLNFLGHQVEIGSFHFYHNNGKTRAYVRIMGRTRQEFTHDGCTPTDLKYRPLKHIPLYMVNIGTVQLSMGIHLSSQLGLDTECLEKDAYQLQPLTDVRIGGEALGTILYARGAANLGGNFNYKLQFTFSPTPDMCIKGSHGYDPMSISFESYFQLWNAVKKDWGKERVWKPNFLSWDVKRGTLKQWFDDTCVGTPRTDKPFPAEREVE